MVTYIRIESIDPITIALSMLLLTGKDNTRTHVPRIGRSCIGQHVLSTQFAMWSPSAVVYPAENRLALAGD